MSQRPPYNNYDDQAVRALEAAAIVAEQEREAYWLRQEQEAEKRLKMEAFLRQQHQQQQQQQQRARQPPNDEVICIDDSDEDEEAPMNAFVPPMMSNQEVKRQREVEAAPRPDPPAKKRKDSQPLAAARIPSQPPPAPQPAAAQHIASLPLQHGFSPLVTQPPAARQATAKSDDGVGTLAGPFVSGVLSGRLLTLEGENNRKKALSNVLLCATGHTAESAPEGMIFPPATIQLNIRQVQVLADGFLDDRNNAVNEAVRIAYLEMKSRHEELAMRNTCDREAMTKVMMVKIDTMKKEHAQQKLKLSAEVQRLKVLYNGQRKVVKMVQKARYDEGAALQAELRRAKSSAIQPTATQVTTVTPEELKELREQMQQQESRHARSISAYVKASAHSLRMLRRTTNVIPGDDDVEAREKEDEKAEQGK